MEGALVAIFIVVLLLFVVGVYVLGIWMIVDAARRPDWQFQMSGQNKVLWIVLGAVGITVCGLVPWIAGPVYFLSVRKKLDAVAANAPPMVNPMPPMPYGGYTYGYGYPAPGPYGGPGAQPPYRPSPPQTPPPGPPSFEPPGPAGQPEP